jgi:CRP-like cAMP-binding protein
LVFSWDLKITGKTAGGTGGKADSIGTPNAYYARVKLNTPPRSHVMSIETFAVGTLNELELFKGLSAEEIETVSQSCARLQLEAGEKIFSGGDLDRAIFVLMRGTVRIELSDLTDRDAVLVELNAISIFGESNFFHHHPHQTDAVCLTEAEVLRFDRATYDNWLQLGDLLAYKLAANAAELLALRLNQTDHWIRETMKKEETQHARNAWREFRSHMVSRFSGGNRMGFNGGT